MIAERPQIGTEHEPPADSPEGEPLVDHLDIGFTIAGVAILIVVLFVPMFLLHEQTFEPGSRSLGRSAEVTVGIGAIVRTMMRRFFRAGTRSLLSTAAATMSRAIARVITRRFLRSSVRTYTLAQTSRWTSGIDEKPQTPVYALTTGVLALFISFWAILLLMPSSDTTNPLTTSDANALTAALIAAIPLLFYAGINRLLARRFDVEVRMSTRMDGLLLQAYFTGAGSFLPITTDIEYEGSPRGKAWVAGLSLASLLVCGLGLGMLGEGLTWWGVEFMAAMFLLYAFVYAFPMHPLDGRDVWEYSRLAWFALFGAIVVAFQMTVPESLTFFL